MSEGAGYRAVLSPEAAADIEVLHRFIEQESPDVAAKVVERILSAIEGLEAFPHRQVYLRGSKKIPFPVRMIPVSSFVIYFRIIEEDRVVRILTVRRGARRPPRGFGGEDR